MEKFEAGMVEARMIAMLEVRMIAMRMVEVSAPKRCLLECCLPAQGWAQRVEQELEPQGLGQHAGQPTDMDKLLAMHPSHSTLELDY